MSEIDASPDRWEQVGSERTDYRNALQHVFRGFSRGLDPLEQAFGTFPLGEKYAPRRGNPRPPAGENPVPPQGKTPVPARGGQKSSIPAESNIFREVALSTATLPRFQILY